jgi:hypothetical protein
MFSGRRQAQKRTHWMVPFLKSKNRPLNHCNTNHKVGARVTEGADLNRKIQGVFKEQVDLLYIF